MHKTKRQPDYTLIAIIGILVVFGLVMLSSATAPFAYQKFDGDSYWFVKHQIFYGLLPGLALFFLLSRLDYRKLKFLALPLLVVNIVLLILVFVPGLGATYGTAKSWLNIGNFSIQPSELIKLTFLIYLALWLERRAGGEVKSFYYSFLPFLFWLGLITLLIAKQPDTGTAFVIVTISVMVYFLARGKISHLVGVGAAAIAVLWILIREAPYRMDRLSVFLHPELDPQGIGYHINQALLAVGSGGIFGRGLGQSRQKFLYLPEIAGDSIYAVMAEELGFIFSAGLVALFLYLLYRGFRVAERAPDEFGKFLAAGIVCWFVIQAFLNIAAMVGLMPMTGIPFPFISYGGTALMASLAGAGVLVSISRYS